MKSTLFITLAISASVVQAEWRPNEHLVLADCGMPPEGGDSTSREMMYYPSFPRNGEDKWIGPDMMVNVPWDGSYPWRSSGVKATFPNGDTFSVYLNPAIADPGVAGAAHHTYDNQHIFTCYSQHERGIYTLDDGKECASAYVCKHANSEPAPEPQPEPEPEPEPKITSLLTLSSDATSVEESSYYKDDISIPSPKDTFNSVFEALEGNKCRTTSYPISDSCTITYDCFFAGDEGQVKERGEVLAKLLHGTAGPEIHNTEYERITYSNQWGVPTYHKGYTYPQSGQIVVSVDNESVQSKLAFEVQCDSTSWFCDGACGALTTAMVAAGYSKRLVAGGVVGTLAAGACGLLC